MNHSKSGPFKNQTKIDHWNLDVSRFSTRILTIDILKYFTSLFYHKPQGKLPIMRVPELFLSLFYIKNYLDSNHSQEGYKICHKFHLLNGPFWSYFDISNLHPTDFGNIQG